MYTVRRSGVRCDNVAEIRQCNRREGGWQSRECRISSLHHLTISHPTNLSSHHLTPLDITISHILNCLRRDRGWGKHRPVYQSNPFCQSEISPHIIFNVWCLWMWRLKKNKKSKCSIYHIKKVSYMCLFTNISFLFSFRTISHLLRVLLQSYYNPNGLVKKRKKYVFFCAGWRLIGVVCRSESDHTFASRVRNHTFARQELGKYESEGQELGSRERRW